MVDSGILSEIEPGGVEGAEIDSGIASDGESALVIKRFDEVGADCGTESEKRLVGLTNGIEEGAVSSSTESEKGSKLPLTDSIEEMVGRQPQSRDQTAAPIQNQPPQMGPPQSSVDGQAIVPWSCDRCVRRNQYCTGERGRCRRCKSAEVRCVYAETVVDVFALVAKETPVAVEEEEMSVSCSHCRYKHENCTRNRAGCKLCVKDGTKCVYVKGRDCDRCISQQIKCSREAQGCPSCVEDHERCLYPRHLFRLGKLQGLC